MKETSLYDKRGAPDMAVCRLKFCRDDNGFSLIELLIVLVIIAALAAIAIPGYIGLQNKAHEASMISTARMSLETIDFWLHSSVSPRANSKEVDTNFDGAINESDKTNEELWTDGVAITFVNGRNGPPANDRSPWYPGVPLWSTDVSIPNGRITLLQDPIEARIVLLAKNKKGNVVFERTISAD